MNDEKTTKDIKASNTPTSTEQTTKTNIRLEPQPSTDPLDPLNWHLRSKILTLAILSLCGFAGGCIALANQYGIVIQAATYHNKTATQLSYGGSAATAGTATGPLLWVPLSRYYGKTSILFWTLIAALGCMVWSAGMTDEEEYVAFILSRWLGASFGGRAYAVFAAAVIGGAAVGGTASGFIVGSSPWPVQFWWIVALLGVAVFAVFFFLDDTTFDRRESGIVGPGEQRSFLRKRWDTLCPGTKVVAPSAIKHGPFDCILIGLQPVTILAGLFFALTFGWAVSVNILLGVFLQTPVEAGGYGFTPVNNACFSFLTWGAVLCAAAYGVAFNDRLPLWMCRRKGGILLPPVVNYITECFVQHSTEVFVILNFYRFILGSTVPFFVTSWVHEVGVGWVFGSMAFFCLIGFAFTWILAQFGSRIRALSMARFVTESEDGDRLFQDRSVGGENATAHGSEQVEETK